MKKKKNIETNSSTVNSSAQTEKKSIYTEAQARAIQRYQQNMKTIRIWLNEEDNEVIRDYCSKKGIHMTPFILNAIKTCILLDKAGKLEELNKQFPADSLVPEKKTNS